MKRWYGEGVRPVPAAMAALACRCGGGRFLKRHTCRAGLGWTILLFAWLGVASAEPRRVLRIHAFGGAFEPFTSCSENFRQQLVLPSAEPLDFFDVALERARFEAGLPEGLFADYLRALFAGRRLDLVAPIGGPARHFDKLCMISGFEPRRRLFQGN